MQKAVKGLMEEHCFDDFLEAEKEKELLKETEAQFQGDTSGTKLFFNIFLIKISSI